MRDLEKFFIPVGGAMLLAGVTLAIVCFVFPRHTAYAPVIPSEPGEDGGDELRNIVIAQPDLEDVVGFPLEILGQARVFENVFQYRVVDAAGMVLAEGDAMADAPDVGQFGSFALSVRYQEPTTPSGNVEVFSYSAKDGSEQDMVRIPVLFSPDVSTQEVSVFFPSHASIEYVGDCSFVQEISRRVPDGVAVAHMAMDELLKGVYSFEDRELFSLIPPQARVRSIGIEDGVATVTFVKDSFLSVAGSCTVLNIRAQIEATLMQFSSVTSVVILEEGKTAEEILQP